MKPLAINSGLQWGWGLLRTDILHKLGRSEEAYNLLRPMIEMRSNDRLGQLRQQLNEMDTMTELVEQHRQGADPNDDLTMLCLRYN